MSEKTNIKKTERGTRTSPCSGSAKFVREERYIVIKEKDLECLGIEGKSYLSGILDKIRNERIKRGADPKLKCVVIEEDWPEYEPVWRMLEKRMTKPTPVAALDDGSYDNEGFQPEPDC